MKINIQRASGKAFSLIETIIAIAILTVVITGPLSLSSQSLKAAAVAKDNFIAANLAQEGIELIRLYRTNNVVQCSSNCSTVWLNNLSALCAGVSGCYIDAQHFNGTNTNFILTACSGACPVLKIDSNGFYNYVTGTNTVFTRTIILTSISADIERVHVTVSWQEHSGTESLSVDEIMQNWLR